MGLPAEKPRRATLADLATVPAHKVAEIAGGVLHIFSRPAPRHGRASSRLTMKLGGPFDLGEGGPGGWRIIDEPELHFGPAGEEDVLVPDLAGWRIERMPRLPRTAYFAVAPDWVCEILSRSTEAFDRADKMEIYAREGVKHAWLIDPMLRTLEVFTLNGDRRWTLTGVHRGPARVRVAPFQELELDLAVLWPDDDEAVEDEEDTTPAPPASKPKRTQAKAAKRPRKG